MKGFEVAHTFVIVPWAMIIDTGSVHMLTH
jgi:hypothetical protein